MAGALERFRSLTDDEVKTMPEDEYQALRARMAQEKAALNQPPDNLLGIPGLDLNAAQRSLAPVERGDLPGTAEERALADKVFPGEGSPQTETSRVAGNTLRNLARFPVDFLQAVNSPIETGEHIASLAKGGLKSLVAPIQQGSPGGQRIDPETDPDIANLREFGRGAKAQITDVEQLKNRPLDPLATIAGIVIPALRGLGVGKSSPLLRKLEDPGSAVVGEGLKGVKRGVGELVSRRPRTTKSQRENVKRGAVTAADAALGFSTSTGELVQRIIREAPVKGKGRIIKAYSGPAMDTSGGAIPRKARLNLLTATLRGVDRIKQQANEFQDMATKALSKHMRTGIEGGALEELKQDAVKNVREFNARIKNEFASEQIQLDAWEIPPQHVAGPYHKSITGTEIPETSVKAVEDLFPEGTSVELPRKPGFKHVDVTGRTGEAEIGFRDFPDPAATQLSSEGRGRHMVKTFHERVLNSPPTTVGALQRFMWEIDDAIGITDNEVGKQANRALVALRNRVRGTLSDQLGEVYDQSTRQYERDMATLSNLKIELGVEPGHLSDAGDIIAGLDRDGTVVRIVSALDGADELAYGTLIDLEKRGRVTSLPERVAGVATQGLLGKGLVARSEVAQGMRAASTGLKKIPSVMAGGGSVGAVSWALFGPAIGVPVGLLSSVVFSPKLMQRVILEVADPKVRAQWKEVFTKTRTAMEQAAKRGYPVSKWVQEGLTLEQMFKRFEAADQENRQRNSTLATLSKINPSRQQTGQLQQFEK